MNDDWRDFGLNLISVSLVTLGLLLAGRLRGERLSLSDVLRRINRLLKNSLNRDLDSECRSSTGRTSRKRRKKNGGS